MASGWDRYLAEPVNLLGFIQTPGLGRTDPYLALIARKDKRFTPLIYLAGEEAQLQNWVGKGLLAALVARAMGSDDPPDEVMAFYAFGAPGDFTWTRLALMVRASADGKDGAYVAVSIDSEGTAAPLPKAPTPESEDLCELMAMEIRSGFERETLPGFDNRMPEGQELEELTALAELASAQITQECIDDVLYCSLAWDTGPGSSNDFELMPPHATDAVLNTRYLYVDIPARVAVRGARRAALASAATSPGRPDGINCYVFTATGSGIWWSRFGDETEISELRGAQSVVMYHALKGE